MSRTVLAETGKLAPKECERRVVTTRQDTRIMSMDYLLVAAEHTDKGRQRLCTDWSCWSKEGEGVIFVDGAVTRYRDFCPLPWNSELRCWTFADNLERATDIANNKGRLI